MNAWRQDVGVVACLWQREMLRTLRERARWAGAVAQPLLFWLIIGGGLSGALRIPGAESLGSLEFFFPGMLVMVVLFTTIFATISVVEDRQGGFLQAVLVAPGSRLALVGGKVAGVTTLSIIQAALFLAVAPFFGLLGHGTRWGSLLVVTLLASVGMAAMNFTVAWLLNSVQAYHAIMSVALIPMWFLSGAMFPSPGGVLGVLMRLNPLTYAVDGLRRAVSPQAAGVAGASLPAAIAALAAYAAVMLVVATLACRRKS